MNRIHLPPLEKGGRGDLKKAAGFANGLRAFAKDPFENPS